MTKLCWTQAALTCIAVVATILEVETIVWSCPAMAIMLEWF